MTTRGRVEHPRWYFQRGAMFFDPAYQHYLSMPIHGPDDAQISPTQRVPRIHYSPTSCFMGLNSLGCITTPDRIPTWPTALRRRSPRSLRVSAVLSEGRGLNRRPLPPRLHPRSPRYRGRLMSYIEVNELWGQVTVET